MMGVGKGHLLILGIMTTVQHFGIPAVRGVPAYHCPVLSVAALILTTAEMSNRHKLSGPQSLI